MPETRILAGTALAAALRDARAVTRACVDDLDDDQWRVPERPGLNPIAWELAHLAWFAEFWVLRGPHAVGNDGLVHAARPPVIAGPDALFDSARLPHAARWTVDLPPRDAVIAMLDAQCDACLEALGRLPPDAGDDALYFHRLVLLHEDMHGEAFTMMRAALAYPPPPPPLPTAHFPERRSRRRLARERQMMTAGHLSLPRVTPGTTLSVHAAATRIGWPEGERGFAFDNERPGRMLTVPAFEIDAAPLTAGPFLEFVEAGGYDDPAYWPGPAGEWRRRVNRRQPVRWRGEGDEWQHRWFDRWLPIDPDQMVVHVNAWEAEAYCRWAGRRLPHAFEWEHVAQVAPDDFLWGRAVWEWTADAFLPYPGFVPGPYKDYSAPWFGSHRELRGGAFATPLRLHHPRFRNFWLPERTDVFAGFRTAAQHFA